MERNDRWFGLVLRAGLLVLFLWMVRNQLAAVALGAIFALILAPIGRRMTRWNPRVGKQAPLILTVGTVVLVLVPIALMAGKGVMSINTFLKDGLGGAVGRVDEFLMARLSGLAEALNIDTAMVRDQTTKLIQRVGSGVASFAGTTASALPGQIVDLFLFVLAIYYFLREGGRVVRFLLALSPFPEHDTEELFASVRDTVHAAVVGQLATSAVQGGLTTLALFVFRVPGALLFGIVATVLSILPLIGTTPVTAGATIYLVADGRYGAAVGMAIAGVIIGLADNVVRPWVQGGHGGLHPLVVLIAIFGGIEVFGAGGVFLGPVIAALAMWIITTYAAVRKRQMDRLVIRPSDPPPPPPDAPSTIVSPS